MTCSRRAQLGRYAHPATWLQEYLPGRHGAGAHQRSVGAVVLCHICERDTHADHSSKPFLCSSFLLSDHHAVARQLLDGLASGVYAVLCVLVTEELTRGSGRFNFVFGLVNTAHAVGDAFSNLVGQHIADNNGYELAFMLLSVIGTLPVILYMVGLKPARPTSSLSSKADTDSDGLEANNNNNNNSSTMSSSSHSDTSANGSKRKSKSKRISEASPPALSFSRHYEESKGEGGGVELSRASSTGAQQST